MSVVTNYNFAHRGLVAFSLVFVYLFLKIIFLCYFLHFLCFDNEDQWYEPSCNGIWQFFLPICQTFRRMVRKTMGKWFFTLQMKWGTACPQVLPNLTHKEAAFQASMETWKNLSILLMQTFLWGWITLKIFSLILLDMPLENVLSSWPVLQQIPLPFPTMAEAGEATWEIGPCYCSPFTLSFCGVRFHPREACLKLHSIVLLPHKMWSQGPSCAFTVPAMRNAREGLEIKTFGSWLTSPSTLGEAGKTGTVETLLGWVVPPYTNQPLRTICRAFEFQK